MPGVVSLCQALLTGTSASPSAAAMLGGIPDVPPALSVWRGLARFVPPQHVASTSSSSSSTTIVRPTPTRPRPHHPIKHAHVVPPELSREGEAVDGLGGVLDDTCGSQHQDGVGSMGVNDKYIRHSAAVGEGIRTQSGTVIIDIAACDGPVFFERVINRAYKANPLLGHDDSETETEINVEELDSEPGSEPTGGEHPKTGRDIAGDASNSSENSNLTNALQLDAASGILKSNRAPSPPIPNNQTSRTYHCVYCNHTFKSHYCYQKHMRRHINPITVEVDKLRGSSLPSPGKSDAMQEASSRSMSVKEGRLAGRRAGSMSPYSSNGTVSPAPSEGLKILDLNVQYFPCKTCGSKFPSYYFVHKHRRMCHQEEENSSLGEKGRAKTPSSKPARTPTPTTTRAATPKSSTS
ncbi:uncharacterized protein LOC119580369 [Penaeus monodon]|uniref:uncharacterized protein LOC119580369 n=1 Tax=Penaeus monodon TaxID=6687 RepID=UPI0018A7156C|nr:uncharacterized protein LOC119580369 [Penaeus monodon]